MALSGRAKTGNTGAYFELYWYVNSQSIEDNSSEISWQFNFYSNYLEPYNVVSVSEFTVKINGSTVYYIKPIGSKPTTFSPGTISTGTLTIPHKDDGTKSFSVSMNGEGGLYVSTTFTASETFEIDTIPRASGIEYAAGANVGSNCNIRWTPAASSHKFRLKFSIGSYSYTTGYISPNIKSTYTFTGYVIPSDVARQIPDSRTGTMAVELYTYSSNNTQIGDISTAGFIITVPQSYAPRISMAVSPVNSAVPLADISTLYIQGKSAVRVNFEGTVTQYGASIVSCVFFIGAKQYDVSDFTERVSDILSSSGNLTVKGSVTDSRGYTTETTEQINVLPYVSPVIVPYSGDRIKCERTDTNDLLIEAGRQYSKVEIDGVQNNFCTLSYRYGISGTSLPDEWTVLLSPDDAEDKVSILGGVTFDEKTSYTVELKAEDDLGGVKIISFAISTGLATFHLRRNGKGAAFGKYSEEDDLFDVDWDARFHKLVNGFFFKIIDLSTQNITLSMTGGAQTMLIFGDSVMGTLTYNETSTTWSGSEGVSCSTSGNSVTLTFPKSGKYLAISSNIFN